MRQAITLLGIGILSMAAFAMGERARGEGFGRWEIPLGRCQLEHRSADGLNRPPVQMCRKLRLDQTIDGLLSARFFSNGQEVVFAGSLASGQRPMDCDNQGLCKPDWPTRLIVSTVGQAGLDRRGLPLSMPTARLASGSCSIQKQRIQCQALATDGEQWRAESSL